MFGALKRGRFRSLASVSYTCSECCWRTSTEKNTCGIARFPCGSTAFLLVKRLARVNKLKQNCVTTTLFYFSFLSDGRREQDVTIHIISLQIGLLFFVSGQRVVRICKACLYMTAVGICHTIIKAMRPLNWLHAVGLTDCLSLR